MKLRLLLLLFCLFGIGLFSHAQAKKKTSAKPRVENGSDAIPVMVTSTEKSHKLRAPHMPPAPVDKNGKRLPPPKIVADKKPSAPPKQKENKPVPPPPVEKNEPSAGSAMPDLYRQFKLIGNEAKAVFTA